MWSFSNTASSETRIHGSCCANNHASLKDAALQDLWMVIMFVVKHIQERIFRKLNV